MKALAESNLKLADAMTNYGTILNNIANSNPTSVVVNKVEGGEAAPAKAKPGPKPKDKPADPPKVEDDGFGEDAKVYTFDDTKAKLMAVKDKNGGDKQAALDIIGKYGYKALPEIGEAHYADIIRDCDAFLAKK